MSKTFRNTRTIIGIATLGLAMATTVGCASTTPGGGYYGGSSSGSACYDCGTIEAVREISTPAEGSGLGAIAGGVLGGLLGNQVGQGKGSQVAAVVGALGGAYAGHQAEKHFRAEKQLEVTVRLDDGSTRTALLSGPSRWRAGGRVRLSNGNLLPV